MQLSAQELAKLLNGSVEGDPYVTVNRPSKIEEGGAGTITFLGNSKYEHFAYSTTASILLVNQQFQPQQPINATLLRVQNVYEAVALLFEHFGNHDFGYQGVSEEASVHPSVEVGEGVAIGPFTVIEADVKVGNNCRIYPQVYIGKGVTLGDHVTLYPGARILHSCKIGNNCVIHPNAVIGGDGFGFAPQSDGSYKKIVQIGNVVLEPNVEIGSNVTIDRASLGSTIIHEGAKLDNLIQVGHNVEIGKNTVMAAQSGVAGSTKIGSNCRIGGQVGFSGHISIADGTQLQAQSGVANSIEEPNLALFGSPAIPYKDYVRSYAVFKKLPELYKRLHKLEKQLQQNNKASLQDEV